MEALYRVTVWVTCIAGCAAGCLAKDVDGSSAPNRAVNGDFEKAAEGWEAFWARESGAGKASLDTQEHHGGGQAIRIEHTGDKDWSLAQTQQIPVKPGEIYELSAWVRLQGSGVAIPGVLTRDTNGGFLDWCFGSRRVCTANGWQCVQTRFAIPKGMASIQFRLIGSGSATTWLDDVVLKHRGTIDAIVSPDLAATLSLQNKAISLTFRSEDATIEVKD